MRRIIKASAIAGIVMMSAALLAGCGITPTAGFTNADSSDEVERVDLTPAFIKDLCGADPESANEDLRAKSATLYLEAFEADVNLPDSGLRNQSLRDWGVEDSSDTEKTDAIIKALKERQDVSCGSLLEDDDTATLQTWNADGSREQLKYLENDSNVEVDTTADPNTPPVFVLDASKKGIEMFESWTELVTTRDKAPNGQTYEDYINTYAAELGFNWAEAQKYAKARTPEGKTVDARAIQVINCVNGEYPEPEARSIVASYIGDDAKAIEYQRVEGNFVNTADIGTYGKPELVPFGQGGCQLRVSLVPIIFDASGKAIALDDSGAGIFVDCGNPHWFKKSTEVVWVCEGTSCSPPLEVVCPYNPSLPYNSPQCIAPPPVVPPNEPKSSDSNDYAQPGNGGSGADVGTGTRPRSGASGSGTAPSTVETSVTNPATGVVDSSSSSSGTETGGTAPGTETGVVGDGGTGNGGSETYPTEAPEDQGGGGDGEVGGF